MLNKVTIIGNLGKDPEIRSTNDGRQIASFSVATSEKWKDKSSGEQKEKTEWHNVVVFSPALVDVIKNFVQKGTKIYIEGSLQTRKWQDKDSIDRYTTEIILKGFGSSIILLGRKSEATLTIETPREDKTEETEYFDDKIPF